MSPRSTKRNLPANIGVYINMSTNPFLNALAATTYITVIASLMRYGSKAAPDIDSIVIPIAFLSLFVLSAAMMGYFFLYQPLRLLCEGNPKESVRLFLATVTTFAGITLTIVFVRFFLEALF